MEEAITITKRQLKEVFDIEARKIVGKCCKRIELFEGNELLKKDIKELLYESFREAYDLLEMYGVGMEATTQFKFTKETHSV